MKVRGEALFRLVVAVVSGIILWVWGYVTCLFAFTNLIIVLITGKRNKDLSELALVWLTQVYATGRYLFFIDDVRPFPFNSLTRTASVSRK